MANKLDEYNATIEALMSDLNDLIVFAGSEPYQISGIEYVHLKMNEVGDMITNLLLKCTEIAERTDQAFIPEDYTPNNGGGLAMLDTEIARLNDWFVV